MVLRRDVLVKAHDSQLLCGVRFMQEEAKLK